MGRTEDIIAEEQSQVDRDRKGMDAWEATEAHWRRVWAHIVEHKAGSDRDFLEDVTEPEFSAMCVQQGNRCSGCGLDCGLWFDFRAALRSGAAWNVLARHAGEVAGFFERRGGPPVAVSQVQPQADVGGEKGKKVRRKSGI